MQLFYIICDHIVSKLESAAEAKGCGQRAGHQRPRSHLRVAVPGFNCFAQRVGTFRDCEVSSIHLRWPKPPRGIPVTEDCWASLPRQSWLTQPHSAQRLCAEAAVSPGPRMMSCSLLGPTTVPVLNTSFHGESCPPQVHVALARAVGSPSPRRAAAVSRHPGLLISHAFNTCRSMSRGRALSVAKPTAGSGLKDAAQRNAAVKIADRQQKRAGKAARKARLVFFSVV